MQTNTYENSADWFQRATKVIPAGIYGHLGPGEGCFMPVSSYPLFVDHADGAYVWDVDGNRLIDYMCAYGPNILGYNDPDVDAAAMAQMKKGNCTISPSTLMVELAELLVDTIAGADWAFFAKNGGDTTSLAVMTAKAATAREKIVMFSGGYHGVAPWTQKLGYPGITEADVSNNLMTTFGDYEALEKLVKEHKGEIAGLIATPYHHPIFEDNQTPPEGYWDKVRKLCTAEGIVLIIDDVRAGFRLDVAGSAHYYGFEPDLQCYCKALANGWNISALVGKEELKEAAASVFYTGSYWLSAVPMAAAIACVTKMREIDSAKITLDLGRKLTTGLAEVAKNNDFDLVISGEPSMWFMRTASYKDRIDDNFVLHQAWTGECTRRGVFFTNHHNHFMNTAMTEEDIKFTLEVADEAFKVVAGKANKILGKEF